MLARGKLALPSLILKLLLIRRRRLRKRILKLHKSPEHLKLLFGRHISKAATVLSAVHTAQELLE